MPSTTINRRANRWKLSRKYVISAEDFESHFSPSEFGPSYSVWIPWDAVGGDAQSISVVPVFRHDEGNTIVGDHSRNLLSGKDGTPAQLTRSRRYPKESVASVKPVNYENEADERAEAEDDGMSVRTSTIRLPASMRQRVLQTPTSRDSDSASGRPTLKEIYESRREQALSEEPYC